MGSLAIGVLFVDSILRFNHAERGLERGAHQKALETARAFLLEGLAPAMVARCTDLPLETVLELAQKR